VLTFRSAKARRAARPVTSAGAALALLILMSAAASPIAARAQEFESRGCVGAEQSYNCITGRWAGSGNPFIRIVPPPIDAAAQARAKERERRWVDRCRPVVVQDRYGVARYRYAKAGCGFGIISE
jgi:hypothetical protein